MFILPIFCSNIGTNKAFSFFFRYFFVILYHIFSDVNTMMKIDFKFFAFTKTFSVLSCFLSAQ